MKSLKQSVGFGFGFIKRCAAQQGLAGLKDRAFADRLLERTLQLRIGPTGFSDGLGEGQSLFKASCDARFEDLPSIALGERLQNRLCRLFAAARGDRRGIENYPSADGHHRRELANDKTVAGQ